LKKCAARGQIAFSAKKFKGAVLRQKISTAWTGSGPCTNKKGENISNNKKQQSSGKTKALTLTGKLGRWKN